MAIHAKACSCIFLPLHFYIVRINISSHQRMSIDICNLNTLTALVIRLKCVSAISYRYCLELQLQKTRSKRNTTATKKARKKFVKLFLKVHVRTCWAIRLNVFCLIFLLLCLYTYFRTVSNLSFVGWRYECFFSIHFHFLLLLLFF